METVTRECHECGRSFTISVDHPRAEDSRFYCEPCCVELTELDRRAERLDREFMGDDGYESSYYEDDPLSYGRYGSSYY